MRGRRERADFRPDAVVKPSSLRWVRNLLPGEEGTAWWAEVISCLAETPDPAQRRHYLRSYRRSVPQLIWTSWTAQVRRIAPAPVKIRHGSIKWTRAALATVNPEDKFGIKLQSKPGPRTIDQKYSVLLGLVMLILGILGFILTGLANYTEMTDHSILGLFQTNGFHNTVYLILGVFWLLGAFALTPPANQGMNIAVGGAFLLVAVLGFLGYWSLLSIPAGVNGDNILDFAVALATLVVGGGLLSAGNRQRRTT
ncbi:MAG: DUF4383 domain-containing protein [Pseudonocardiaceae bacterium]